MHVSGSLLITASFVLTLNGCNDASSDLIEAQREISTKTFSTDVEEFEVRVFYEVGAAPRESTLFAFGPLTWDITEESFATLFETHLFNNSPRIITVPKKLEEMKEFPDQGRETWSTKQLKELSDYLFKKWDQGPRVVIPVIFLNGSYRENTNILGLHLIGRPHAFVFADNIPDGTRLAQKYAEQSVVVHEIGHAIGLIGGGVPLVDDHEEKEHRGHSSNTECVMHFAVELRVGILSIIRRFITQQSLNLFGADTLKDAYAFHP